MTPTEAIIATACALLLAGMTVAAIKAGLRIEQRLELYRLADLWAQGEEPDPDWHPSTAPLTGDIAAWEAELRREDHE